MGYSQNSAITDFKENHPIALALYFYPSTLRMINIDRNPEFDEMIKEIKRARFFRLDSGTIDQNDISKLSKDLQGLGFEELMIFKDKSKDVKVWGVENRNPQIVIISKSNKEILLLEVNGMINIAKIPKLAETFGQHKFLDVLHLNQKNN